eukprot:1902960-Alexandrium_andersonii.AAC.1
MRGLRWGPRGVRMKVATNVRDLGAHLNVHAATRCGTAVERIERALLVSRGLPACRSIARRRCLLSRQRSGQWPCTA